MTGASSTGESGSPQDESVDRLDLQEDATGRELLAGLIVGHRVGVVAADAYVEGDRLGADPKADAPSRGSSCSKQRPPLCLDDASDAAGECEPKTSTRLRDANSLSGWSNDSVW